MGRTRRYDYGASGHGSGLGQERPKASPAGRQDIIKAKRLPRPRARNTTASVELTE